MSRVSVSYPKHYRSVDRDSLCIPHLRPQGRLHLERLRPDFLIKKISSTCHPRRGSRRHEHGIKVACHLQVQTGQFTACVEHA